MGEAWDVVVIGAGPAGEACAGSLAKQGKSVALVERELVAGECSYWGCIPSKVLLRATDVLHQARGVPGAREAVGRVEPGPALAWRDDAIGHFDDTPKARMLEKVGVEIVRGEARLCGGGRVAVGERELAAGEIVVATGSDAAFPPIEGLAGLEGVWTNREVTTAREVPESLLVLGGGPIGAEMSQAMARLGARVTVVEAADRLLGKEPPEAADRVARALEADGVELRTGARIARAERRGDGFALVPEDGEALVGEKLLVATGRTPRTRDLGLEEAGVELGEEGEVLVDERCRAAPGVWAIGDVTMVAPFTHLGKYQARVVAHAILGRPSRADYRAIPRVTFTDPQVASVGVTEDALRGEASLDSTPRATTWSDRDEDGFLLLFSDGEALTGACAVGPDTGEWIGQATLAIRARLPLETLKDTIQPFPTFSEAFAKALGSLG